MNAKRTYRERTVSMDVDINSVDVDIDIDEFIGALTDDQFNYLKTEHFSGSVITKFDNQDEWGDGKSIPSNCSIEINNLDDYFKMKILLKLFNKKTLEELEKLV